MELFENEKVLFQNDNAQLKITNLRIQLRIKNAYRSQIKSFLIENLDSCELRRIREYVHLRRAVLYFILINGIVFLMNQYLFESVLLKKLVGTVHIDAHTALIVMYCSLAVVAFQILSYITSIKSVLTFSSSWSTIDFEIKKMKFDQISKIIDLVEKAKLDIGAAKAS